MRKFVAAIAVLLTGTSLLTAAEMTPLAAAEAGDHAAAIRLAGTKERERQRHRRRWRHRRHVRRGQQRSRTRPGADQSRRQCQTGQPARQFGHHRSRNHRLRADRRCASQSRRRSQLQNYRRRNSADGCRAQRQSRRGEVASRRRSRHQCKGKLGRPIRPHVGRRAGPGRHGDVPRVEGREPERSRQGQSVGTQNHSGASS